MGCFIDSTGNYYEGDRANLADRGVPQRPSPNYIFVDGAWVEDTAKITAEQNETVKTKLTEIDLKSIRSLREWVAKQPDAPQWIKDYEAQAQTERAKLK
jgi:hypothetical protein